MNVLPRRAVRTAARSLVVPAVAVTVLAVTAPQAAAHTELDTASPGASAALAGLPPRVTLTFSDAMTQKYAKVAVTGPDGESAAVGQPEVRDRTVSLTLDTGSPAGRYTVGYRVVSADGHPVSGAYSFTVRASDSPTPAPRAVESAAEKRASAEPSPEKHAAEGTSGTNTSAVVGGGTLVLVLAAVGAYVARRRRAGRGD
ncbi:copper resistance CopC family protein [Streptomyces pseudovenezuelae]|uniref:copper resistance protein CopC n=1 Tax=Streptomyces pseudovenezuelae TaxID=67350 RepID=UPI0034A11204